MTTDYEAVRAVGDTAAERNSMIAKRLTHHLGKPNMRELERETGYNYETIRRYLSGTCRIPADFVGVLSVQRGLNAHEMIVGQAPNGTMVDLRGAETRTLLEEVAGRLVRLEDCAVGRVLLS